MDKYFSVLSLWWEATLGHILDILRMSQWAQVPQDHSGDLSRPVNAFLHCFSPHFLTSWDLK